MRSFKRLSGASVISGFQSHHLIPVGVFANHAFAKAFEAVRPDGFDVRCFPRNGVFLPATELAAMRSGLPLHRGPHRRYNELVAYRVAAIFRDLPCIYDQRTAREDAVERLHLLTGALRTGLYGSQLRISLNQRDPLNTAVNFDHIDSACDAIWLATK